MVEAKRHIPHYSYIDECDLTDLVRLRSQLRDPLAKAGVKLTYLAFFVKAAARALKDVPMVNSTFDEPAGEVVLHDKYHIGVAVAAPNGLIVPVVKDADKKDLLAIAVEIDRLSTEAKAGKSRLEDLKGSTFTVTSVGGIGGLVSTPIINYPEVGIMGVGKVVKRPVYDANGNLRPADIIFLSFSFDHRVVDGAVGAAFGNAVIRYLHAPALLLLPEKAGG
jgi:pyruvate dehydrogenase E2 component (dihydrolipoamide acetyltransferase)/2-oxoisovalerate dehydrogenase E2 component (dihydrolipoyl transacylase)